MKYRVDVFGKSHVKHFFEKEEYAREYAKDVCKRWDVAILEEIIPGKYDVVDFIEKES